MKSPGITYLVTRVHGLKTHLIKPEDITAMLKSKSLKEFVDMLLKTEYAEEISLIPNKDLDGSALERLFLKKLVERAFFILQAAPSAIRELLVNYYRRFEVENIKRILRAKHAGEEIKESNLIPLDREYSLVNFSALLLAKDVQEVIDLLRETIYSNISQKKELYTEYGTTLVLEAYLDNLYYSKLWSKLDKIADKGVHRFFIFEVDLRNLLLILGMKIRELEKEFIETNIISVKDGLNKHKLLSLIKTKIEEAPRIININPYRQLLLESIDLFNKKLFAELEHLFNYYRYRNVRKSFSQHQFDESYVFAYIALCEIEAKNLIAIALCKELLMDEEELKKFILI